MNPNLKANERELIKLIDFFRKRAEKLITEGTLSAEEQQVTLACQNLAEKLHEHADNRIYILEKREKMASIVQDHAICPKCQQSNMLKFASVDTNEKGWKSNRYKCRRCNIAFTWNRPNNPWDLLAFLKEVIAEMETSASNENLPEETRRNAAFACEQMLENVARLEPVLAESDEELKSIEMREREMGRIIHDFKNYLLIEKIKMDVYVEPEDWKL